MRPHSVHKSRIIWVIRHARLLRRKGRLPVLWATLHRMLLLFSFRRHPRREADLGPALLHVMPASRASGRIIAVMRWFLLYSAQLGLALPAVGISSAVPGSLHRSIVGHGAGNHSQGNKVYIRSRQERK